MRFMAGTARESRMVEHLSGRFFSEALMMSVKDFKTEIKDSHSKLSHILYRYARPSLSRSHSMPPAMPLIRFDNDVRAGC